MSFIIPPDAKSWLHVQPDTDFPIQNLPFGIFQPYGKSPRSCIALGDQVIDLLVLFEEGFLSGLPFDRSDYENLHLNAIMSKGKGACTELRKRVF
ncbi:MAG: fumarylacetoacetase, partial [Crocinitomicaceae bacterium]|nr:fumarylacetoacetase [Crocinitomicaceae bacterium]